MKLASLCAALAAVCLATTGCSSKPDKQPEPQPQPAPVAVAPAPAPVAVAPVAPPQPPQPDTVPADFPPECRDYAALIDKLKLCDKLGGARDGLMVGYNGLRSAWRTIPTDQRAGIAGQCKIQADSLRNAAAATCAW
jgi:hypothetical protein